MPRFNLSSPSLLLAYLLVLSAFTVVHALPSPFPSSSTSALPQRRADPEPESCGFDGDDNTYGLGIRLGLYIQWLTAALCNLLGESKEDEAKSMKGVNLTFQIAVFGGLLYVTITRGNTQAAGQLYAAEVWLILGLCAGGILTVAPKPNEPAFLTQVVQHAFNVATLSYALWFIFTGMDQMAHPSCSRYAFFFAKVDLYHWYRLFWKITGVPAEIGAVIGFLGCLGHLCGGPNTETLFGESSDRSLGWTILGLVSLGGVAAATELTIRWNHIHQVNSIGGTGQLIPLFISCLGLIRLLYKLWKESTSSTNSQPKTPSN